MYKIDEDTVHEQSHYDSYRENLKAKLLHQLKDQHSALYPLLLKEKASINHHCYPFKDIIALLVNDDLGYVVVKNKGDSQGNVDSDVLFIGRDRWNLPPELKDDDIYDVRDLESSPILLVMEDICGYRNKIFFSIRYQYIKNNERDSYQIVSKETAKMEFDLKTKEFTISDDNHSAREPEMMLRLWQKLRDGNPHYIDYVINQKSHDELERMISKVGINKEEQESIVSVFVLPFVEGSSTMTEIVRRLFQHFHNQHQTE